MYFESLGRHLSVSSLTGAQEMLRRDGRGFWNVISILSPSAGKPLFSEARRVLPLTFDDAENESADSEWVVARPELITRAFAFWVETAGEPVLVHCLAGLSRSTGLALALIALEIYGSPNLAEEAVDILLQIRPQARPNVRVLELGLRQFLSEADSRELTVELSNHPRLVENRFVSRRRH
jgi:predicted protein tyrosine phosphatase